MHRTQKLGLFVSLALATGVALTAIPVQAGQGDAPSQRPSYATVGDLEREAPGIVATPGPKKALAVHKGVFGSTPWGGLGIERVVSAYPAPSQALVLSLNTAYHRTHGVFSSKDRNARSSQSVDLAYAPIRGLELSASFYAMVNTYTGLVKRSLQAQGNPTVRAKYGHTLPGPFALGVQVAYTMPTSALGHGLLPEGYALEGLGLISFQAHPRIEVVGNVGYRRDCSDRIFSAAGADRLQRFAYGINRVHQVPYGLGAQGRITLANVVDLTPFLEISGGLGLGGGSTLKNDPFRGSAGLKIYPTQVRAVELVLGSDVALGGRPRVNSPFGGLPAWELFAQLHAHLGNMLQASHQTLEPVLAPTMAHVIGNPQENQATFRLRGTVLDADTLRPIYGARVEVGDQNDILLATDDTTGRFNSWPISAEPGLIRVTARAAGYVDLEQVLPRPGPHAVVDLAFHSKSDGSKQQMAILKGILRDAHTGRAIANGTLHLVETNQHIKADASGAFAIKAKPGRYTLVLGAANYADVQRTVVLRPSETLLYNVDLKSAADE